MEDTPACASCSFWRCLGPRSYVGRCVNKQSGQGFTNYRRCCSHHLARFVVGDEAAAPVR